MKTHEVFGTSPKPRETTYIDRGLFDAEITRYLPRHVHLALRGESKCGKSWLRQRTTPDAIVVQCRLSKTTVDIYTDILADLDVRIELSHINSIKFAGKASARGELGATLLAKLGIEGELSGEKSKNRESKLAGHDVHDLRFVADLVRASGRRLVIEDFHYLTAEQRKVFSFDLKALWDFGLFVTIIGIWNQSNMLLFLNPDLAGRVHEISLAWTDDELDGVLKKGSSALGIEFSSTMRNELVQLAVGNVGILQRLTLMTLDAADLFESSIFTKRIDRKDAVETAALLYAEQLNPLYQQFAKNVSSGIRTRKNSTGIYAHAMAAIIGFADKDLVDGLHVDKIYSVTNARQPRIQLGNLKAVLERFEELQVDKDGRGLVLAYNPSEGIVSVVDRQLLLYRRYCTVQWPWEDLINEVGNNLE